MLIRAQAQRVGARFLNAELEIGLTCVRIARAASSPSFLELNRRNARKAYESALQLLWHVPEAQGEQRVQEKFELLRMNLEELGEQLEPVMSRIAPPPCPSAQ